MKRVRLAKGNRDWIEVKWDCAKESSEVPDPDAGNLRCMVRMSVEGKNSVKIIECESLVEAVRTGHRMVDEAKQLGFVEQPYRARILAFRYSERKSASKAAMASDIKYIDIPFIKKQLVICECEAIPGAAIWHNGDEFDSQELAGAEQIGLRFRGIVDQVAMTFDNMTGHRITITVDANWLGFTPARKPAPKSQGYRSGQVPPPVKMPQTEAERQALIDLVKDAQAGKPPASKPPAAKPRKVRRAMNLEDE